MRRRTSSVSSPQPQKISRRTVNNNKKQVTVVSGFDLVAKQNYQRKKLLITAENLVQILKNVRLTY
jgi:hypothetical protein